MTALFERAIRLGGDPQGFDEFKALQQELAKLTHPACPDLDWASVEGLCLRLFELNGIELQTAVAYVMARAWRAGLVGMREGVALLVAVLQQWPRVWPTQVALRIELLAMLFAHLQVQLRAMQWGPAGASSLPLLASELGRLEQQLIRFGQPCPATLQALRNQVGLLLQRVAGDQALGMVLPVWGNAVASAVLPLPAAALPTCTLVFEPTARRRSALAGWLAVGVLLAVVVGLVAWYYGQSHQASKLVQATPVALQSLSLFEAGSAQLGHEATQQLLKAVVDIKAHPGWLIVIAGHADASGDAGQNMALSRARAFAVRDWLQRVAGIPDSCFALQELAASQPLLSNDTTLGRAANRRVDIQLVPQASACQIVQR